MGTLLLAFQFMKVLVVHLLRHLAPTQESGIQILLGKDNFLSSNLYQNN